jgi:hypothetical protein
VAIWQFKVDLIPQCWLDASGNVASLFDAEGYEVLSTWVNYSNPLLEQRIGSLLPPGKSWHVELTCWGSDKTEDIQLWRDRGHVRSLVIRFDLRRPNIPLFNSVVAIARELGLAILVPNVRRVIDLDVMALLRVAAESDAAHFALDPHSFLLQLDAANAKAT